MGVAGGLRLSRQLAQRGWIRAGVGGVVAGPFRVAVPRALWGLKGEPTSRPVWGCRWVWGWQAGSSRTMW